MHNSTDHDAGRPTTERARDEQFPVDAKVLTKVRFENSVINGDILRIVVMNDQDTPQHSAYHEYYYGNLGVSLADITAFTMRSGRLESTQEAVQRFVGEMGLHLDISQNAIWDRGVYSPSGAVKRLYKAIDPDDRTKMIGVLLEQDEHGSLTRITWYKTQDAKDLFHSTPDTLDFELVKDERGAPSLDPNDIAGWTWYYTTSLASGS